MSIEPQSLDVVAPEQIAQLAGAGDIVGGGGLVALVYWLIYLRQVSR